MRGERKLGIRSEELGVISIKNYEFRIKIFTLIILQLATNLKFEFLR